MGEEAAERPIYDWRRMEDNGYSTITWVDTLYAS